QLRIAQPPRSHSSGAPAMRRLSIVSFLVPLLFAVASGRAQEPSELESYIRLHYTKQEHMIPMRDGVKLFTAVYLPRDTTKKYPLIMKRTPYSVAPYGVDKFPASLGPSD